MACTISWAEVAERLKSGEKIKLLDLRKQADFEAAPELFPGAIKLDPAQVEQWEASLGAAEKVVIYCARGGSISQSIQQRLEQRLGDVSYVEGGYEAWRKLK